MSWSHVKKAKKISIFTTWVFKYKFNNDDYLLKHKARLCVRKNFQQTKQDVYAATLIIRIFRALMIIVIVFELSIRQYDAVNAFANNDIDEFIYCKSFDDWKKTLNVFFFYWKHFTIWSNHRRYDINIYRSFSINWDWNKC